MLRRAIITAALLLSLAPVARATETVPFINDDFARALAQAKAKNLPIFVEAWAPW
jgi:hypothetical protein